MGLMTVVGVIGILGVVVLAMVTWVLCQISHDCEAWEDERTRRQ